MTRVARQRMFPDSPVCCPLCGGGPEHCSHLFFQCPLAQEAWRGDGGGPTLRDLGGDVLELQIGRLFQTGGGLEADLRHFVGDLDPQERGHLQGHLPVWRCHYTYN